MSPQTKPHSLFPLLRWALAGVLVLSMSIWGRDPQPAASDPNEIEDATRWSQHEHEVGPERYSAAFIDSLKLAKNFGDNSNLGNPITVPYRREKLVFDGGWGFLRAGWAILIAEPDSSNPEMTNHIGKVISNNFVSTFYKVRDYVNSHCLASNLYPLFFEQHISEGRYTDHRWTLFDHANHRVYNGTKKGELDSPTEPGIQDYLSLLYVIRAKQISPGDTFSIRCFYHRKDYPIRFKINGRKRIDVPAGTFTCVEVEPELIGTGRGFNKGDKLSIWLTDDEFHTPVLVKAKINIGSLSARLLYLERE